MYISRAPVMTEVFQRSSYSCVVAMAATCGAGADSAVRPGTAWKGRSLRIRIHTN